MKSLKLVSQILHKNDNKRNFEVPEELEFFNIKWRIFVCKNARTNTIVETSIA